jgi:hypothetical protein
MGMEGLNPKFPNGSRRRLLKCGLGAAITALAGCGGGSDASSPLGSAPTPAPTPPPSASPPPAAPDSWNPNVPPLLVGSNATFNLSSTLPNGIARGGKFGLDPNGPVLPRGMSLSADGVLAVGSASIGSVAGVIFTYETP